MRNRTTQTVAIAIAALAAAPARGQVIRVNPEAAVRSAQVRLADVAELWGGEQADRNRAAEAVVVRIPAGEQGLTLKLEDIRQKLGEAGVNLAAWRIRGSSRCRVSLAGAAADASTAQSAQTDPASLERKVYEYVAGQFGASPADLELRFSQSGKEILGLCEPQYGFRIEAKKVRGLSEIVLSVDVLERGERIHRVPLLVEGQVRRKVVTGVRTINEGEIIRPEMVRIEERLFGTVSSGEFGELEAVVNQQARRVIKAREPVRGEDLKKVILVSKNKRVDVIFRAGGLTITDSAVAGQDGSFGDVVMVRNGRKAEQVITGRVVGRNTVELLESGRTESGGDAASAYGIGKSTVERLESGAATALARTGQRRGR